MSISGFKPLKTIIASFMEDYVLTMCADAQRSKVATANSTHSIKLYDTKNYDIIGQLDGHTDQITQISFLKTQPDVLCSCAHDGTIRFWDTRTSAQGLTMKDVTAQFNAMDLAPDDLKVVSGDKHLVKIWDSRTTKLLQKSNELHSDDVLCIKHHPSGSNLIFTGSEDGLVNCVNFEAMQPEDIIEYAFNINQPVSNFGFTGAASNYLWALTTVESFSIYSLANEDAVCEFGSDFRQSVSQAHAIDYFITCHYHPRLDKLFLFGGSFTGQLFLFEFVMPSTVTLLEVLEGHQGVVRSVLWDFENDVLISGGEDARVIVWTRKVGEGFVASEDKVGGKLQSSKLKQNRVKSPYSRE